MCAKLKFRIGICAVNTEIICRTRVLHTFKNINIKFFLLIKIWSRRERQNDSSCISIVHLAHCKLVNTQVLLVISGDSQCLWGIAIISLSVLSRIYWWCPDMKPFMCSNWKMRAMVTVSSKYVKQKPRDYIPHLSRDSVDVSCVQVNFHAFRAPENPHHLCGWYLQSQFCCWMGPQLRSACWCPSSNILWVWTILVK